MGPTGMQQVRWIARDPRLEPVGVLVHGEEKNDRDAGELAGIGPLGIRATTKIEDILALDADVALHNGMFVDYEELCAVLRSGKNVVRLLNTSSHPNLYPDYLALEAACKAGGSTFMGAGVNPGYAQDVLPLVATALCTEVSHVHIYAGGNIVDEPLQTMEMMRFGQPLDEVSKDLDFIQFIAPCFSDTTYALAEALNMELDEVTVETEFHPAPIDIEASIPIRKGTVAGFRFFNVGRFRGEPRITCENTWFVQSESHPDPWIGEDRQKSGWTIEVTGKPDIKLVLEVGDNLEHSWGVDGSAATMLSQIPTACDAEPGTLSLHDAPIPRVWQNRT
jgi:hypothetical protein